MQVIVVGAGPGGMMAAICAAEAGAEVTLLEKKQRPGRKMRITGKGRCNITNAADTDTIIKNIHGNGHFLYSVLHAFNNRDVMDFFERAGVPLKVERGNRVFPQSDKAEDAVEALIQRLRELGVTLLTDCTVQGILQEEGHVAGVRTADSRVFQAERVILATGGASYPVTGSTGDGYRMAKALGHTVTPILPSLVPLETEETWVKEVQGLSLRNVRVRLLVEGKRKEELFGEMMFTHFGVTGPLVLSLSRRAAQLLREGTLLELSINMKPALTPEQLDARIQRDFQRYQRKNLKNAMTDLLPQRLIPIVLDAAYLDEEKSVHQVTAQERRRLRDALQDLTLTITGTRPIAEAIVTAGGISVKEINPKSMESKLVKGLYFVGEMVDVDAYTGGYNLQAAFSMGAAAGSWSAREERKSTNDK